MRYAVPIRCLPPLFLVHAVDAIPRYAKGVHWMCEEERAGQLSVGCVKVHATLQA